MLRHEYGPPLLLGEPQICVAEHEVHAAPPLPQVLFELDRHWPAWQHPPQEVLSQTQLPLTQRWPLPHDPVWQMPPQPSLAPHGRPLQVGMQAQARFTQLQSARHAAQA